MALLFKYQDFLAHSIDLMVKDFVGGDVKSEFSIMYKRTLS